MTNARKHNPTEDLKNLERLVQRFQLMHGPLDHSSVREERACERCRVLKDAKRSLQNLHDHRAHVIEKLEVMFG